MRLHALEGFDKEASRTKLKTPPRTRGVWFSVQELSERFQVMLICSLQYIAVYRRPPTDQSSYTSSLDGQLGTLHLLLLPSMHCVNSVHQSSYPFCLTYMTTYHPTPTLDPSSSAVSESVVQILGLCLVPGTIITNVTPEFQQLNK